MCLFWPYVSVCAVFFADKISKQRNRTGERDTPTRISPSRSPFVFLSNSRGDDRRASVIARLDKAVASVVFTFLTYMCIRALTPSFDQWEESNVQTNAVIMMHSIFRRVK